MKNKKYHTVRTFPKSNKKNSRKRQIDTAHFPGLVQYFNKKCRGMLVFYEPKESLDSVNETETQIIED